MQSEHLLRDFCMCLQYCAEHSSLDIHHHQSTLKTLIYHERKPFPINYEVILGHAQDAFPAMGFGHPVYIRLEHSACTGPQSQFISCCESDKPIN